MVEAYKQCLWTNFGAAIDMLSAAVSLCPEELWQQRGRFYLLTYHVTIFLDYYLSIPSKDFNPMLPYTLAESDSLPAESVDDVLPNRDYSKIELLTYIALAREKCRGLILYSQGDKLLGQWIQEDEISMHGLCPSLVSNYSVLEILFYNLRHVQHHVAQLNIILRQTINKAPDWVAHTDK